MTPTDAELPDHPDDELVSRVLDGDASEAERRRVEDDPALRAKLAAVAEAAAAVGAPVPVPEGSTNRAVAAALAAADELDAQVPTVGPSIEPTPLADPAGTGGRGGTGGGSGRARRRRAAFAVAAAVLVAVLVPLGVLVVARAGDGQSDLASSGDQADEGSSATSAEDSAGQSTAGGAGEAPTDGFATSSGPGSVDLGEAASADALVALARDQLPGATSAGRDPGSVPSTTTPPTTTTIPSAAPSSGGADGGEAAASPLAACLEALGLPADQAQVAADHPVAIGTVDGVPVVVTLSTGPDGAELIAWQIDGCVVLSRQPLSP
jgi:hypothetical protein